MPVGGTSNVRRRPAYHVMAGPDPTSALGERTAAICHPPKRGESFRNIFQASDRLRNALQHRSAGSKAPPRPIRDRRGNDRRWGFIRRHRDWTRWLLDGRGLVWIWYFRRLPRWFGRIRRDSPAGVGTRLRARSQSAIRDFRTTPRPHRLNRFPTAEGTTIRSA